MLIYKRTVKNYKIYEKHSCFFENMGLLSILFFKII